MLKLARKVESAGFAVTEIYPDQNYVEQDIICFLHENRSLYKAYRYGAEMQRASFSIVTLNLPIKG